MQVIKLNENLNLDVPAILDDNNNTLGLGETFEKLYQKEGFLRL